MLLRPLLIASVCFWIEPDCFCQLLIASVGFLIELACFCSLLIASDCFCLPLISLRTRSDYFRNEDIPLITFYKRSDRLSGARGSPREVTTRGGYPTSGPRGGGGGGYPTSCSPASSSSPESQVGARGRAWASERLRRVGEPDQVL